MKKLLKILFMTLCFTLLMGSVYGAEGGTNVSKTEEGDQIIYSLNLTPNSGIQAGDFEISYKGENLEYISHENGPLGYGNNVLMVANHVPDEQKIYVSYASLSKNPDGGTLLNIRFKKKADSQTPVIGLGVTGQYDGESQAMAQKIVTGDQSVAEIASGENINTIEETPAALTASDEKILVQTEVDEKTKNEGTAETVQKSKPASGSLWLLLGLSIVILAALGRWFWVRSKKDKINTGRDES